MAGPAKKRQAAERQTKRETTPPKDKSPSSSSPSDRSPPISPSHYDGNRDPAAPAARAPAGQNMAIVNRNVDIGAFGASLMQGQGDVPGLPLRPAQTNKSGREISVKLNTYAVMAYPSKPVYQFDVLVGNGTEKKGLITKVWHSRALQTQLGPGWLFDGQRLAWSMTKPKEQQTLHINLADERPERQRQQQSSDTKKDEHRVVIRFTKQVDFGSLRSYLDRTLKTMNEDVLEAINFLDHLMRESPSQKYTTIKRNFFAKGTTRFSLGGGIEAFKGVYASIRMVNNAGVGAGGSLSVNVDVANTTFWTASKLMITCGAFLNARDPNHLSQMLAAGGQGPSMALVQLRKMRRIPVYSTHLDPAEIARENPFFIGSFLNKTPRQFTFKKTDKKTGQERDISIEQHFKDEYKINLQYPNLPVVQMTKEKIVMPMELLTIAENHRYGAKLSDRQTSEMIKFAVTLPDVRWSHIDNGVKMLDWGNDRYLANYGLKINPEPTTVKARLLPNPKVGFGGNKNEDPRTSGRWDLRNKTFAGPHQTPLERWGVCVVPGRGGSSQEQVKTFISTFINTFTNHGGKVMEKAPIIMQGSENPVKDVEALWTAIGKRYQKNPQLLVFVVPDKDSQRYIRIKRNCDCRFGVVSQVLQAAHVAKAQAQYCSNISMKVNAKLGGMTSKAVGMTKPFTKPTMIIGADVSHAAPGSGASSVAALTVSFDREAIRYAATCQTNGQRVEMITKENIETMLKPLVQRWISTVGNNNPPQHVLYFRDGVSEGQYAQVLREEVRNMKEMFQSIHPNAASEMTVVVCSKRHHVRFFPGKDGDRNANPQPGTLVETGVTHPFEYDFYLNAHSAIKGTARPMHYHVLKDEAKMGVEQLQNYIYEASYQYVRSTTPVSMFPAIYYAHLAAARAVAHIDPSEAAASEASGTTPRDQDVKPLTAMNNQNGIRGVMWYV